MLVADRHGQRRDDGQGQRHAQGHARALARRAVDLDDAADPLDVGADDVHADAAAGNRGDLLGGRQAGFEDQRQLLARASAAAASALSISVRWRSLSRPASCRRCRGRRRAMSIRIWLPDWRAETRQEADLALAGLEPLGRASRCHDRPRCG